LNFPASEIYAATERWLGYHVAGRFPRELALYEDAVAPPRVRKRDRHQGRWYRLDHEPPLMNNSVELERVLKRSGHQINLTKRPREKELIALVFSDAAVGEERLLLLDIGVASKKATPDIGKDWPARAPQLYIVSHDELFRRLEGVRDVDRLQDKRVACFGLGAIGSPLAIALTREGVGSFALCDPDTLRPGNLVRHALDLLSVGQFKAEAVDAALSRINPAVDSVLEMDNLSHPDVLATMIRGADLVVAAIGNDLKGELLCEVVVRSDEQPPTLLVVVRSDEQPPMLLVRTLHAGAAFRVALIRPGRDACVTCLADYRTDRHPDWIDVPTDNLPDVFDAGCAAPATRGRAELAAGSRLRRGAGA